MTKRSTSGDNHTPPFDGLTVVDLTTFVTGGFCSLMLANLGAEVIKIERPGFGDDVRYSGPPFVEPTTTDGPGRTPGAGESPYFWTLSYGKRSIELNLKDDRGREILYELLDDADVFLENFRPGTAERLGVGYDDVVERNEDIIYCSISAFGDSGPWAQRPGYDLLVQGMSGIMSVTGEEDGDPVKVGLPVTDLITASWAAFGIASALYRRANTGTGERVELGMLEAALPWLTKQAGKAFVGETPTRMGTKDPVLAPYQSYRTADGYLNVACANQKLWKELCTVLDRSDLIEDPRFETNADRVEHMDALEHELETVLTQRTTDDWVELLAEQHGLPVGPVFTVDDAVDNEHVRARDAIGTVDHPAVGEIPVIEHPLNFDGFSTGFDDAPPLLGEDTIELLLDIGFEPDEIDALRSDGVIGGE